MKTTVENLIVRQFDYGRLKGCVIGAIIADSFDFCGPDGSEHNIKSVSISKMVANELSCSIVFVGDNREKDAEKEIIVLREKLIGAAVEVENVDPDGYRLQIIELL